MARADRRLSAILAADIVGYARLVESDESATLEGITTLRTEILNPLVAEHRGRVIKLMGDGVLVEFASVVDTVNAAVAIQERIAREQASQPEDRRIVLRMGVNLGDVVVEGDDLMGDGVNVAARLEQFCPPGGILISGTVFDQLQGKISVPVDFVGEQRVKNIARPVRVYSVAVGGKVFKPRRVFPMRLFAMAVALVILVAGGAFWVLRDRPAAPSVRATLAVLPFDNYGAEAADARLADALTEDIITDLARFRDLSVMARNSTAVYKGKSVDIRQVGKDLDVRYVLEGSFQRSGDQGRFTAQLIDARTGAHVWSERYDRPVTDLFQVQSDIADKVANTLGGYSGLISKTEVGTARRKRPESLSAYEVYLLGVDAMHRNTEKDYKEAAAFLQRAVQMDPNLARAYTALSWACSLQLASATERAPLLQQQLDAARKAVELDPMDAEAHAALGEAYGNNGDTGQTRLQYDEALRLNPNSFDILTLYAGWASSFGEAEKGAQAADRARAINRQLPNWARGLYRYAYFMVGRYQDAVDMGNQVPRSEWHAGYYAMVAGALAELGRLEEARKIAEEGVTRLPALSSIEAFALRGDWPPHEELRLVRAMRVAGFPLCATGLAAEKLPKRLPECSTGVP
jgi:TolB-like protein/class 3 adenylate cyclase